MELLSILGGGQVPTDATEVWIENKNGRAEQRTFENTLANTVHSVHFLIYNELSPIAWLAKYENRFLLVS